MKIQKEAIAALEKALIAFKEGKPNQVYPAMWALLILKESGIDDDESIVIRNMVCHQPMLNADDPDYATQFFAYIRDALPFYKGEQTGERKWGKILQPKRINDEVKRLQRLKQLTHTSILLLNSLHKKEANPSPTTVAQCLILLIQMGELMYIDTTNEGNQTTRQINLPTLETTCPHLRFYIKAFSTIRDTLAHPTLADTYLDTLYQTFHQLNLREIEQYCQTLFLDVPKIIRTIHNKTLLSDRLARGMYFIDETKQTARVKLHKQLTQKELFSLANYCLSVCQDMLDSSNYFLEAPMGKYFSQWYNTPWFKERFKPDVIVFRTKIINLMQFIENNKNVNGITQAANAYKEFLETEQFLERQLYLNFFTRLLGRFESFITENGIQVNQVVCDREDEINLKTLLPFLCSRFKGKIDKEEECSHPFQAIARSANHPKIFDILNDFVDSSNINLNLFVKKDRHETQTFLEEMIDYYSNIMYRTTVENTCYFALDGQYFSVDKKIFMHNIMWLFEHIPAKSKFYQQAMEIILKSPYCQDLFEALLTHSQAQPLHTQNLVRHSLGYRLPLVYVLTDGPFANIYIPIAINSGLLDWTIEIRDHNLPTVLTGLHLATTPWLRRKYGNNQTLECTERYLPNEWLQNWLPLLLNVLSRDAKNQRKFMNYIHNQRRKRIPYFLTPLARLCCDFTKPEFTESIKQRLEIMLADPEVELTRQDGCDSPLRLLLNAEQYGLIDKFFETAQKRGIQSFKALLDEMKGIIKLASSMNIKIGNKFFKKYEKQYQNLTKTRKLFLTKISTLQENDPNNQLADTVAFFLQRFPESLGLLPNNVPLPTNNADNECTATTTTTTTASP